MAVAVGHELVGSFRGRIKLQRVIDALMLTGGHSGIGAIDTARARVGQMRHLRMTTGFEEIGEGDEVAFDIRMRILKRIPHTRLSG